jgi:uncharacterized membrane protein (DUF4010 family)
MTASTVMPGLDVAGRLALAGLSGLAIGVEREWSGHASGPHARFAGVRTFLLLGLVGGMAGWLTANDSALLGVVLLGGAALLAVLAYVVASRQTGDRDGTTEAAALLVLATGSLCGLGYGSVGSGVAAVAVLALAEKSRIQRLIAKIGEHELRAALHFAVLAVVVLPLLPPGPFGPYDSIRPRELWTIVLIFSGLNFLGYLARRAVGAGRGYAVTGLLGGLVSSTAVTLSFSRESRSAPQYASGLALGVVAACSVLLARVLAVTLVLSPPVAERLVPYVVLPGVVGGGFVAYALTRRHPAPSGEGPLDRNPLRLGSAVQMVLAFQLVLLAVPAAERLWGPAGVLGSAAVLGLTDMDALTYSMSRLGATVDLAPLAARAIAIGILSNTLLKLALVLVLGSAALRRTAAVGLSGLAAAIAAGLLIWN